MAAHARRTSPHQVNQCQPLRLQSHVLYARYSTPPEMSCAPALVVNQTPKWTLQTHPFDHHHIQLFRRHQPKSVGTILTRRSASHRVATSRRTQRTTNSPHAYLHQRDRYQHNHRGAVIIPHTNIQESQGIQRKYEQKHTQIPQSCGCATPTKGNEGGVEIFKHLRFCQAPRNPPKTRDRRHDQNK